MILPGFDSSNRVIQETPLQPTFRTCSNGNDIIWRGAANGTAPRVELKAGRLKRDAGEGRYANQERTSRCG